MSFYKRSDGKSQPHWKLGSYQLRIPFIHTKLELPEIIQGIVLFAIGLSIIPLLENYAGFSYEAALAVTIIFNLMMLIPVLFGVPFVPGMITPAIPLVIMFLGDFEGPDAARALIGLQLTVALIFLILGITGLGKTMVTILPDSLKAGILLGAGIAAIIGEIEPGGRLATTPISLIIGSILCFYFMFSKSFQHLHSKNKIARMIANFGIMPAIIIAILVGWLSNEYPMPTIEWGFVIPNFTELWNYTPFVLGFPSLKTMIIAVPTAIIAYIIAYGDIIVGTSMLEVAKEKRKDEKISYSITNLHILTFIRNLIHGLFSPQPGLCGPIFTAGTASVLERFKYGRNAMDSVYSGTFSLILAMTVGSLLLPLVTLFQPVLPIALSITLIVTGYLCISIGIRQLKNPTDSGVAGITAIVLVVYGAAYALVAGVVLYWLLQRKTLWLTKKDSNEEVETDKVS